MPLSQKKKIKHPNLKKNRMIKRISAAGGVVFSINNGENDVDVLLIYRNKCWDLPKGKLETGESILMCASREVAEETQSELPIIIGDLGTTYHEYTEKNILIGKTTYWYSMVFPRIQNLKPQTEEGIEQVEWIPLRKAIDLAGFDNLKEVLRRFENQF